MEARSKPSGMSSKKSAKHARRTPPSLNLDDWADVRQYIFDRFHNATARSADQSVLPYFRPTAVLRRIVFKVGCAYHRDDKIDQLHDQCETARINSNAFSIILRSVTATNELSGLSASSIRKSAPFMDLARRWRIHPDYLDHFVDQMGGWHSDAKRAERYGRPRWIKGITVAAQAKARAK